MKSICLYLKIHQPMRLKRYRFFDIGNDHYYYDDFANDDILARNAEQSYIPMAHRLLDMIQESDGGFKCALAISGIALEQLQLYVPEFIELLKKLADTGCVEFLSEPYSHGLASLEDPEEFIRQVKLHDDQIRHLFGKKPKIMNNTELIYDDDIAAVVASMGFKGIVTDGAKHILGWKSPNYIYSAATAPNLKLLLVNEKLTDDIARNFNNPDWPDYPLTADKYIDWIANLPEPEQVVNLYFSMDTFGIFLPGNTGIFDFLSALPRFAKERDVRFATPSEVCSKLKAVAPISVPFPLSATDEARDVSAWKGNELQREALGKLYSVAERVSLCSDKRLKQDWNYLQSADHFYYMSTKKKSDGSAHAAFSPYDSPFAAFTNYMNVLADFIVRVEEQYPTEIGNEELNSLLLTIKNQANEIDELKKEVTNLRTNILNADDDNNAAVEVIEIEDKAPKKAPKAKAASKKAAAPKKEATPKKTGRKPKAEKAE